MKFAGILIFILVWIVPIIIKMLKAVKEFNENQEKIPFENEIISKEAPLNLSFNEEVLEEPTLKNDYANSGIDETIHQKENDNAYNIELTKDQTNDKLIPELRTVASLRKAVILREILGPPLSLR